jgi:signal transduction histidine kinase
VIDRHPYDRGVPVRFAAPAPEASGRWGPILFDVAVVTTAIVVGAASLLTVLDAATIDVATTDIVVDAGLGVLASLTLLGRRRWPLVVGGITAAAGSISVMAGVAALFAVYAVASRRPVRDAIVLAAINLLVAGRFRLLPAEEFHWVVDHLLSAALYAAVIGWAVYGRARQTLLATYQERAERVEAERVLLDEHARVAERTRIAREMHDVLGHRISLLALHAGGLEVQPDRPAAEIAETGRLLSTTAHQALEDLRSVIGVLRSEGAVDAPSSTLPTFDDLPRLVAASRAAGAVISLSVDVDRGDEVPVALGRDTYRIVQEALTNVAKHAPGASTILEVSGEPTAGLAITVRNQAPSRAVASTSGGGAGLIGLAERVELAGGDFSAGRRGEEFVVEARLPW